MWAVPGKRGPTGERKMGRAQQNMEFFDLFKRISKGSELTRLKDGCEGN
jgi:hypothetical protein